MTSEELQKLQRECTHFLGYHLPRTVSDRMQEIADSRFAELRPDMYGNGGYVAEFEKEVAERLGKEAAVFMPSGTMAQTIALRIWADRASNRKIAFHPTCHLELHEHKAYQELHHLEATLLGEPDRLFSLFDLEDVNHSLSSLLIELPQREIGGQLPSRGDLAAIYHCAKERGIRLHLDGARLWECQPYFGKSYQEIVEPFDSVYVSFYKILGGLPGAALAGPADFIADARIWMRRHGGNLVHMFPNAISAKIGLDHYLPEIPKYVSKAQEVARLLNSLPGIKTVPEVPPTNLMHIHFKAEAEAVRDAVGEIATAEKLFLFGATPKEDGSRTELTVGDAALEIPLDRLEAALSNFSLHLD